MCYAKPGPRCSPHASQRYEKTGAKLKAALEEAQPELDRINEERRGVQGAKRATEADLPEKLRKKLQVARGRHRDATRQFDATPAGVKYLDEKVKESALKTKQAVDACNGWIAYKYPGETEESVKEQLKKDEDWTVLKQERTSCRSELTRVANRRENAEKYRSHDIAEYKAEKARRAALDSMIRAGRTGDMSEYQRGRDAYNEMMRKRSWNNTAEMQRRKDPAISSPIVDDSVVKDSASKRMVSADHSINLSQGGRMSVTTRSYIARNKQSGHYYVRAHIERETHPEDPSAHVTTRKGFGRTISGKQVDNISISTPSFSDLKEAESYLRDNKKQISYKAADYAVCQSVTECDKRVLSATYAATNKTASDNDTKRRRAAAVAR